MPNWLIEDLNLIAILLGVGALLFGYLWLRDVKRKYLIAAGVLSVLALAAIALWYHLNADQRQIKRKVNEMAAGIPRDLDLTFSHISGTFRYGHHDKRSLRRHAEEAIKARNVTEVRVWDIEVPKVDRVTRKAEVEFRFRVQGNWGTGVEHFICRATFDLDTDGEWRLTGFQVYSPTNIKDPLAIPGL